MARTSKSAKSRARKISSSEPETLSARVVLHPSEDVSSYYVNFVEVASSQNEFSMYGVQVPTKMSSDAIERAKESGEFHITAEVQIIFPVTMIQDLIDALAKQRDFYCKQFGASIYIKGRGKDESETAD